jgi:hypothetical protein
VIHPGNILHNRYSPKDPMGSIPVAKTPLFWPLLRLSDMFPPSIERGTTVVLFPARGDQTTVAYFINTFNWDKKLKIAVLTLATFLALC